MTTSWHWQAYTSEFDKQALCLGLPAPFPSRITHFREYIANLRHKEGKDVGILLQGGKVRGITVSSPFAMFEHCVAVRFFVLHALRLQTKDISAIAKAIFSNYGDASHLLFQIAENDLTEPVMVESAEMGWGYEQDLRWRKWKHASIALSSCGYGASSICLMPISRLAIAETECCLMPFRFGAIFLEVTDGAVTELSYWRTGERTSNISALMQGLRQNIVNQDGTLCSDFEMVNRVVPTEAPIGVLASVIDELTAYFSGRRQNFSLPYSFNRGTEFQRRVWTELAHIPYGVVISYEDLAALVAKNDQKPRALARAVGAACSANPVAIMVPCHRVIGKNNNLTGYNGGVEIKAFLLDLERFAQV